MIERNKHKCTVLVCPDCGKKYTAKTLELLVFAPFNTQDNKGKRSEESKERE